MANYNSDRNRNRSGSNQDWDNENDNYMNYRNQNSDDESRRYSSGSGYGQGRRDSGGNWGDRYRGDDDWNSSQGMYGGNQGMYTGSQGMYGNQGIYGERSGMNRNSGYGGRESYRDWDSNRGTSQHGYGRGGYRGDNDRNNDRGWWDKTKDEVSSWFGDDEAERRRQMDNRQEGQHRGKGPKGYTRSDDRIKEDINDKLSDDSTVDASDIDVSVNNCEVTLTGTVGNRWEKRRAEDVVESVSGVKHVENRLRVNSQNTGATSGTSNSGSGMANTGSGTIGSGATYRAGTYENSKS
jgi:osmotically-inducible protein OsmY